MTYFLQGFGVFLGVLAGTAVTILTNFIIERRRRKQKLENLKFEIRANLERISQWQDKVADYRDAVNAEALQTWAEWLNFSHIMQGTINDVFQSGLIYDYLPNKHIANLQAFLSDFSQAFEHMANQKINEQRNAFDKESAVMFATFLQNRLRNSKENLEEALDELDKKP